MVKFDWFSDSASLDSPELRPFIRFSEMQFSGTSARRREDDGDGEAAVTTTRKKFFLSASGCYTEHSLQRGESHMFLTSFLARYHNYSPSSRTPLSSIPPQNQHLISLNNIYLSKSRKTTAQQQSHNSGSVFVPTWAASCACFFTPSSPYLTYSHLFRDTVIIAC